MKTLKRSLCLVLALVMVVGLLAVGASAATHSDSDEIQYEVPVGVMTGMGIINGYDDGTFQPAKTVNRAEAAKMICYALIGKNAADGLVAAAAPFADVPAGDWYAPYVSYLKAKGVVDGYDDGLYHANYPVTGIQLAKMLLTAVGYGKEDEYVGEGFAANTYIDALSKGTQSIFYGTKATDLTAAATREEAALYIYNAMCYITQVTYSPGSVILGIGPSYSVVGMQTMAAQKFGYAPANFVTGYVVGNSATDPALAANAASKLVERTSIATAIDAAAVKTTYNFKSGLDLFGHKVNVYLGTGNTVYYVEDLATVTADITVAAASASFTSAALKKVGFADAAAVATVNTITGYTTLASAVAVGGLTTGATATLIANNADGKLDTVVLSQAKTLSKVTAYTAPTAAAAGSIQITGLAADGTIGTTAAITLQKLGSTTPNVVNLYDGIKLNDYVYVTKIGAAKAIVEKATVVTGTMSYFSTTSTTVAGASYGYIAEVDNYNATFGWDGAAGYKLTNLGLTAVANVVSGTTQYNFVLLSNGKIAGYYAYSPASAANDYAVVLSTGTTDYKPASVLNNFVATDATAVVYLALADGSKVTYNVQLTAAQKQMTAAALDTALFATPVIVAQAVVKYAVSGTTITELALATTTTGSVVKGSAITGPSGKYFTANTKFLYWDGTISGATAYNVNAFTGYANAPTTTGGATAEIVFNAANEAVFAYINMTGTTTTTVKNLIYLKNHVPAVSYDANLKANVYAYAGYVDGVATTLYAKSDLNLLAGSAPYIYQYTLTDGYLSAASQIDGTTVGAKLVSGGGITFVDSSQLVYKDVAYTYANAKVITVANTANSGTVALGSVAVSAPSGTTTYIVVQKDASTAKADISYIYVFEN